MSPQFRLGHDRYDFRAHQENETDRYSELDYETITTNCPLCGEYSELDFHHWVYPPSEVVGTHLCRDCHLSIHAPNGARPSESVGNNWVRLAISELIELWVSEYPWVSVEFLRGKFNIPARHREELVQAIQQREGRVEWVGQTPGGDEL